MSYREMFSRRLRLVIVVLVLLSIGLLARLVAIQFQLDPEVVAYLQGISSYTRLREYLPTRGQIYDRDGELLAVNTLEYEVGASPSLIADPADVARQLAIALNADELDIYNALDSDEQWVLLARPVRA